jgi:hypothetical protein
MFTSMCTDYFKCKSRGCGSRLLLECLVLLMGASSQCKRNRNDHVKIVLCVPPVLDKMHAHHRLRMPTLPSRMVQWMQLKRCQ